MEEKPVRRRRRNPGGSTANGWTAAPANTTRRPLRRRRRRQIRFTSLNIKVAQACQSLLLQLTAWIGEQRLPWAEYLRSVTVPPSRRRHYRRPRRIRWKVPTGKETRGQHILRSLRQAVLNGRYIGMAALLAACGCLLLAVGGRGIWRFASSTQADRATGEAVEALYDWAAVPVMPAASPEPALAATMEPAEEATPSPPPTFHQPGGTVRPELAALAEANGDLVGWLYIPDVIDQPVLYRNNVYYETHDFYGRESAAGAVFLDDSHPLTAEMQNVLLHGHNMKDGSMFGRLLRYYKDADFLRRHGIVHFDTLYEEGVYAVFAVLVASFDRRSERYFDAFSYGEYRGAEESCAYIAAVQARSLYDVPIEIGPEDALLTLSTCLGEDRLVILARRLREGETQEGMSALLAGVRKK